MLGVEDLRIEHLQGRGDEPDRSSEAFGDSPVSQRVCVMPFEPVVGWQSSLKARSYLVCSFSVCRAVYSLLRRFEEAKEILHSPGKAGVIHAQALLGFAYFYSAEGGPNEAEEFQKAVYWYKKAADRGCPVALQSLGWFYREGRGCEKNIKLAIEVYRKSAEKVIRSESHRPSADVASPSLQIPLWIRLFCLKLFPKAYSNHLCHAFLGMGSRRGESGSLL